MGKKSKIIRDKLKDQIINDIWMLFETEERRRKRRQKKKTHNERIIKAKKISDIRTLFQQQEEDYYKSERVSNIWNNNHIEYESKIYSSSDKFLFLSL